jgi:DNA-directed RNA polymerase specialized sigma24 family protein
VQGDAEAYVALYDAQAVRLHAYCWSLVGDKAAAAVRDVFTAAAYPAATRQDADRRNASRPGLPPSNVWLYRRARSECLRRGPVTVISGRDPLLRAAARLRADQREALVLAADFTPHDVARVLAMPPARVMQLLTDARARLEQAALSLLLADPATARHEDIIGAFEKGALGTLLARRAPAPPRELREVVVNTFARERAPLVVISPQAQQTQGADGQKFRPRHAKVAAPVIGVAAACAAAVVGAMAAGATLDFDTSNGSGGNGALAPSSAGQSPGGQGAQSGGGGQPSISESPAADVTPTTSAEPRPIQTEPGQPPSPESSTSPPSGLLPPSLQSPGGSSQQTAPDPSEPADSDTPSPPESSSPSETPSASPSGGGGGLLDDLPILGRVVGSLSSGK